MKFVTLFTVGLVGLTSAAPAPVEKRWPAEASIKPSYISQYEISSGKLTYAPATGKSYFDKTSTIVAFSVPDDAAGKKCALKFYIDPSDTSAYVSGGKVQIFSTNQVPPQNDVASWGPPGNQRNQHLGNLAVVKPGFATGFDWPQTVSRFDCPPKGMYAYEVVPMWDTKIDWSAASSGLYMQYV